MKHWDPGTFPALRTLCTWCCCTGMLASFPDSPGLFLYPFATFPNKQDEMVVIISFTLLGERDFLFRNQQKNNMGKDCLWMIKIYTHRLRSLVTAPGQSSQNKTGESQKCELRWWTDKSYCLALPCSLFWSKAASPITFSLVTGSDCQHWDWRNPVNSL